MTSLDPAMKLSDKALDQRAPSSDLVERLRVDIKAHEVTGNGNMRRVDNLREAATDLTAKDARIAEQDDELARLRSGLEEAEGALTKAQELAKIAEGLTGCRGDDDFVRSVQEVIDRALASIRGGA